MPKKTLEVQVTTLDAVLEFSMEVSIENLCVLSNLHAIVPVVHSAYTSYLILSHTLILSHFRPFCSLLKQNRVGPGLRIIEFYVLLFSMP